MAEIEITLPTVQYGNVKIKATPEEWGTLLDSPHSIGMMAATYINLFTQGFKAGSQMDMSAPVSASQEAPPGDPQAAAERLTDGRLPRTVDEYNEMAKQVIESELGPTTEVEGDALYNEAAKPWDQKVDTKKKPWETGTTTTEAVVKPPVELNPDW